MDWAKITLATYKKDESSLYFLPKLWSFRDCTTKLTMFYESVVANTMKVSDTKSKVIKILALLCMELDSLEAVADRRMLSRLQSIFDNVNHALHSVVADHRNFQL